MAGGEHLRAAELGLWLGHQRTPDPSIYNAAECLVFEGAFEPEVFEAALAATVAEADALAFCVGVDGGRPRRVDAARPLDLERADPVADVAALIAYGEAEVRRPFALESAPLFRHTLVPLADGRYAWLHVAHHLLLDGYGFNLIARRVAQRYTALRRGEHLSAGAFTPIGPVVAHDTAYAGSDDIERDRAYWHRVLQGRRGVALGHRTEPAHALRRRTSVELGPLERDAKSAGVAWTELLLARLARHFGEDHTELVLGLPVMLRLGTPAAKTPCTAMNIAPLPVEPNAGTTAEVARAVRASLAEQRRHQRYRYEDLRAELPQGSRLFGPVINIMPFDFPVRFDGLGVESIGIAAGPVEDLALSFAPRAGVLHLTLDAHPSLFDADAVEHLIRDVAESTGPRQRRRSSGGRAPACAAVHRHARERPAAIAVVDGGRAWTYAELDRAARGCAGMLRAYGVGPGAIVAMELGRDVRSIVALLGVRYSGAAYLALDPAQPEARRQDYLERADPKVFLHTSSASTVSCTSVVVDEAMLARWGEDEGGGPFMTTARHEPAYVVFTSGSSGTPKGVEVSGYALASFVDAVRSVYALRPGDRVLQFASLAFDASVEEVFATFDAGATLVLRPDDMLESIPQFIRRCAQLELTVLDLPTAFWHELTHAESFSLPTTVRLTIIGGEAALLDRVRRFVERAPHVRLLNTYGPSEATVVATYAELTALDDEVPIGQPLPGVDVLLRDVEDGVGEIYIAGPTLASGYLGRAGSSAFCELEGIGRVYRTKDRARRNARGELVFVGRVDDELKIAGYRVAPAEVEAALAKHPSVRASAVTSTSGILTAYVESDADVRVLRAHIASLLPAPMVPARIERVDTLPLGVSGKIDRAAFRVEAELDASQARVIDVWAELLGHRRIALDDDFFALGGHSLLVLALANRLSTPALELDAGTVFANPTPRRQAALLDGVALEREHFTPTPVELHIEPGPRRSVGRTLLTGATGYLGVELLAACLERQPVVCVVRGPNAAERLARHVAHHGASVDASRLEIVEGDLVDSSLELPACDRIVHAAAEVSLVRDYTSLFDANVVATARLLERAARWGAELHLVSTVAVVPRDVSAEEVFFDAHAGLVDGYQRSKWHAEALAEEASRRGVRVAVHRLGRIVGALRGPVMNPADLVWRIVRASVRMGAWPIFAWSEPWLPSDVAAEAIVRLAEVGAAATPARYVHVLPNEDVAMDSIHAALVQLGHHLPRIEPPAWFVRLATSEHDEDRATHAALSGAGPLPADPKVMSREVFHACLTDFVTPQVDGDLLATLCARALNDVGTPVRKDTQ